MATYSFGFPRLGKNREFKKCIENFWNNISTEEECISKLNKIEEERINIYKEFVDNFPLGEFTYYDNVFDTSLVYGIYKFKNLHEYFEYARGSKSLSLKKYFNTNYHYLVPVISSDTKFRITWNKPLIYFNLFFSFKDCPVYLLGPYTFLKLSVCKGDFNNKLFSLIEVYKKLLCTLLENGVHSIHLEEPYFVNDIPLHEQKLIIDTYTNLLEDIKLKVNLITYYDSLDFLPKLYDLPFDAIGLDFVDGIDNISLLRKYKFPSDKKLICGIVSGRNPRRVNIFERVKLVKSIAKIASIKEDNLLISNSCPLFHLPFSLENERKLPKELSGKISFAKEKLYELNLIQSVLEGRGLKEAEEWSKDIKETKNLSYTRIFDTLSCKSQDFRERKNLQKKILNLPLFPTTTIGSFPQDENLRRVRKQFKEGKISKNEYEDFIKNKIKELIVLQENLGLDVLVHGEFERTDMVEFFAQKLRGFYTTEQGWIISYGTRVYRPPLIFDKIVRDEPITAKEILYAQSLTTKPVKGIITGPLTIIAWSYSLRDIPVWKIAFELAKALNEEIKYLANQGIKIIQIDEPAIREAKPLKKRKEQFYFSWAIRAFNLTAKLPKSIQVHTHMCYSQFGEILKWIMKMNFDVITIESARDKFQAVEEFRKIKFNRQIGPGVWDIHSKLPVKEKDVREILDGILEVFIKVNKNTKDSIWINPDCGLKTRDWPETIESLKVLVKVAKEYREKFKDKI